jgi:glycosyltransferase involved in cell wall biosynthesis
VEAASISGTAKAVLELAYEARADVGGERPVEVFVANFMRGDASADNALTRALQAAQIPFAFIREQGRFDRSVIPQIRELVRQNKTQVIWTNSVKSHFLVYRAGVQRVCQWVAFHHGYTSTDFKMRLYNEMDRISLRHANRVVTVCKPFAAQMEGCGVPRSRIRVQHMPIRPFSNAAGDSAELRSELKLPSDAKVVLSVGRLSHEKGHADLLTAFARLGEQLNDDRLRLVLVGDGPERAKLERQAIDYGINEQLVFTGQRDDAKRFYGIATVFALPSYTEGTPNVLLESMAAGVPVVAAAVGGIPELVSDGRNALLVPSSDPAALANGMASLMLSPSLRNDLAKAARNVVDDHSPRSYFEQMRKIFVETLDERLAH